jgi:hypothetical protein
MNAFNHGVPICHYEAGIKTSLPVIRGFSIFERFTAQQLRIVGALKGEMTLNALSKALAKVPVPEEAIKDDLIRLKKMEMVKTQVKKGKMTVFLTDEGITLSKIMPREKRADKS